jgi:hypothetical protein
MSQSQSNTLAVSQTSLYAMLSKNWGSIAKPGNVTFENASVTAGTPVNLLTLASGPGVISSMWTTCGAPGSGSTQNMLNGVVQVYVDGESTPSISFDLGGPLAWYQSSTTTPYKTFTKNFMAEQGTGTTQFLNPTCHNWMLPIPYQSSIIVNFIPTQSSSNFFFNIRYISLPQHIPFKLYSQCVTFDNSIGAFPTGNQWTAAQLGNGSVQLLNVPGGSGYIAAAWLYFLSGAANMNTLNCDINTYLNGNTPGTGYLTKKPDLSACGIDGFFRYKYTSTGVIPFSILQSAVSSASAANGTFHGLLDIAAADGCWRFTNGAIMQLESGQAGNGGNTASIGSGVLYYLDIP